jgi:hypothetical protein
MASVLLLYVLETYYIKSCKIFEGLSPHAFENPTVSVARAWGSVVVKALRY